MSINVTLRGGSGDMNKSTYDPNLDGIIEAAQVGILPAAKIGNLPSSKITSGTFDLARLPALSQIVHAALGSVTMDSIVWFNGASVNITTLAVDVLIVASIQHQNNNINTYNAFRINIDSASYSQTYYSECGIENTPEIVAIIHKASLSAAAHTIKVQGIPESTTGQITKSDIAVIELKK